MYPASNATNPPKLNFSVRVEIREQATYELGVNALKAYQMPFFILNRLATLSQYFPFLYTISELE